MAKVDMHLHSKYSDHPSEWFLQRLGTNESYTEPEKIYQTAKDMGMNFVTVTDHNKIEASLRLKEKYPSDVFTGVEFTTYFPENQCKVHLLCYGIEEQQFEEIQHIRKDIYDLRDYLRDKDIPHSLAHATFSVNGKLSLEILEKLILLFDIFEGINGGRNKINNTSWMEIMSNLTPDHIEDLYRKYRIAPFGDESWIKGFTGGSDDHAGLFIGQTYTCAEADTIDDFLKQIKCKKSLPKGRHNNYQSLAFMFYKIAYDFSKQKGKAVGSSFLNSLTELVFEKKTNGLKNRILINKLRSINKKNDNPLVSPLYELIDGIDKNRHLPLEDTLQLTYQMIAKIADEFFKMLLNSLEKDLMRGDFINIIRNISASIPGIFLSVPFFSTIKLMSDSRNILSELTAKYGRKKQNETKRILWFTDTLNDMNGVSMTLKKMRILAHEKQLNIHIVTAVSDDEKSTNSLPNSLNLPAIYSFRLPGYERYTLMVPSILKSLEMIYKYDPDEIIISTPGPVGLFALLAAKLLNIKSIGIYHTDYALQTHKIIKDESVANTLESYVKSFYSGMDEIRVPSQEYMRILENRGFDRSKMKIFRRGIDSRMFSPRKDSRENFQKKFRLQPGFNMLYVGRISQDKELDFLIQIYSQLIKKEEDINLLVVGDGPYLKELQSNTKQFKRIVYTGPMEYESLPDIYSGADLFIFPSIADTFGMVVLEAQSCGLPALVSERGGPKEIIIEHQTGFLAEAGSLSDWTNKILFVKNMIESYPHRYFRMKEEARNNVLNKFTWDRVFYDLMDDSNRTKTSPTKKPVSLTRSPLLIQAQS